jgi:hypothetical protein
MFIRGLGLPFAGNVRIFDADAAGVMPSERLTGFPYLGPGAPEQCVVRVW